MPFNEKSQAIEVFELAALINNEKLDVRMVNVLLQNLAQKLKASAVPGMMACHNFWIDHANDHFQLLYYDSNMNICTVDSFQQNPGNKMEVNWKNFPRQNDQINCGIFCLIYVYLLENNRNYQQAAFSQQNISLLRILLAMQLMAEDGCDVAMIIGAWLSKFGNLTDSN